MGERQGSDWEGRPRVPNLTSVSNLVAVGEGTRNVTPAFDSVFTTKPASLKLPVRPSPWRFLPSLRDS